MARKKTKKKPISEMTMKELERAEANGDIPDGTITRVMCERHNAEVDLKRRATATLTAIHKLRNR